MLLSFISAFHLALRSIIRNKLRATLTVLGILIGVAAVIFVAALGSGARANINEKVQSLGSNVVTIFSQANQASGARKGQGSTNTLSEEDARALVRDSTSIAAAAPILRSSVQLVYESRNTATTVYGTTLDYLKIRAWDVERGETFRDSSTQEKVALLGTTTATELFGTLDPIGRTIRLGRHPFRVIAVLASKGQSPFGNQDQDNVVIIPINTFRSHVTTSTSRSVDQIMYSASSEATIDSSVRQAEAILRQLHRIPDAVDPDFVIRTQSEIQQSQDSIYGALSTLLLSVGLVSLGVGGIGIMNIMLVSVAERTKEIGIRMAIGAREGDILIQFLVEAVLLSLIGGLGGTLLGIGLIAVFASILEWPMTVQVGPLLVALFTSMMIGVVFGFFPARHAARMDPTQALGRD